MKKITLLSILFLSLFSYAEDEISEDGELEEIKISEVAPQAETKPEIEESPVRQLATPTIGKGINVTKIPFPDNGQHFFGHRIVDDEKGVVCYTVGKPGTGPQLWCTKQ